MLSDHPTVKVAWSVLSYRPVWLPNEESFGKIIHFKKCIGTGFFLEFTKAPHFSPCGLSRVSRKMGILFCRNFCEISGKFFFEEKKIKMRKFYIFLQKFLFTEKPRHGSDIVFELINWCWHSLYFTKKQIAIYFVI